MSTSSRSNINPSAYADVEQFPLGSGDTAYLPKQAKSQAANALAQKLSKGFEVVDGVKVSLHKDAADAVAASVVDPAAVRHMLDDGEFDHDDTPSGLRLVELRTRVWTAALSGDGANGRSRLEIATSLADGPWPIPRSGVEPILSYHAASVDRLANSVVASARQILTVDSRDKLTGNPRGVWQPITAVLGQFELPRGKTLHVLHAAEGSTRTVGAQHLAGIAPDAPLRHAGDPRVLVRSERARVASDIVSKPDSLDALYALRFSTVPVRIVVAVLDENDQLSNADFSRIIGEYIESVHVEPRGWKPAEQGNVQGERLVQELETDGKLTSDDAADILGRDHFHTVSRPVDHIAATLVRAVTHPDNYGTVRRVILEPRQQRLSAKREAAAVGPILLRCYRETEGLRDTATTALSRPHLPDALDDPGWDASDRSLSAVLKGAEKALDRNPGEWSNYSRELVAGGVGAMCGLGLVLSDQGQAVDGIPELRGDVDKVMTGLAMSKGGLRTIADAIKRATGGTRLYPPLRKPDGSEVTERTRSGEVVVRYDPENRETNIAVRTLALCDGKKPRRRRTKTTDQRTPAEKFVDGQKDLMEALGEAAKAKDVLSLIEAEDTTRLLDSRGLDRALVGDAPQRLLDLRDFVTANLAPEPPDDELPVEGEPDAEEVLVADVEPAL